MRCIEQRTERALKGLRWSLLKDRSRLTAEAAKLDALAKMTTVRTARAWVYKERLREILERKQINIVRAMLQHWCSCVMALQGRADEGGRRAGAQAPGTHRRLGPDAANRWLSGGSQCLFQAAKRRARGFTRMSTIRTAIFLIAGKLNFRLINPHASTRLKFNRAIKRSWLYASPIWSTNTPR
jgi:transposase